AVAGRAAAAPKPAPSALGIGFVFDGPGQGNADVYALVRGEIEKIATGDFRAQFPDDKRIAADWTTAGVQAALDKLVADPDVDIVVALGVVASHLAARGAAPPKPVIAPAVLDAKIQDLPNKDGTSGVQNLSYLAVPTRF